MNDIYTYTVPMFIKLLGGLKTLVTKARDAAKEKGVADGEMLNDRLAPDMFPLVRQIQIACDNAKGATARLAAVEPPTFEDNEERFDQLLARIDATVDFIKSVPESAFVEAAGRKITMPYFPGKYFTGFDYAREYAIPNFLFHVVTAYAIIRKNGVAIGKADFMNGVTLRDL